MAGRFSGGKHQEEIMRTLFRVLGATAVLALDSDRRFRDDRIERPSPGEEWTAPKRKNVQCPVPSVQCPVM